MIVIKMYAIYGTGEYGTCLITLGTSLKAFKKFGIDDYDPKHVEQFGGISGYEMSEDFQELLDKAGFKYCLMDHSRVEIVLVVDLDKFDVKDLPSQWDGDKYVKHNAVSDSDSD